MWLRIKLPLFTSITVFLSIVIIAVFAIYDFRQRTIESIENYRQQETEKIKGQLRDIVNIAYAMIDQSYKATTAEGLQNNFGITLRDTSETNIKMVAVNILNFTLSNLRVLKFGTDGYIWINNINPPYVVVMHPIKPELEGEGHVFYIEDTDVNVYEAFANEIRRSNGEGFLTYNFYKPGSKVRIPKLSYIKLYEPLGWVIGTGVYVDHIERIVDLKTAELNEQINKLIIGIIVIGILLVVLSTFALSLYASTITKPIFQIQQLLSDMAKGYSVNKLQITRKDEIGQMKTSLDALIDGFKSYSDFAMQIGKGNLLSNFEPLSNGDILGNSLLEMRKSLLQAQEEDEKRKIENSKRQWVTEGNAIFSDILRNNTGNINELAYNLISVLVKYLKATQGGLFLFNDERKLDPHIELVASIAYNRRKFTEKKIQLGDGLIGACFFEKESIYMTKIPAEYLEIKSGTETITPKAILLVPVKSESLVIGVVELSLLNELEHFEIEFVERVCENIGTTIFNMRANQRTNQLYIELQEKNKEQREIKKEVHENLREIIDLNEQLENKTFEFI